MTPVQFIWHPPYMLAVLIDNLAYGDHAWESLVAVFPAFIVGLISAVIVFPFLFTKSKWICYHVLKTE